MWRTKSIEALIQRLLSPCASIGCKAKCCFVSAGHDAEVSEFACPETFQSIFLFIVVQLSAAKCVLHETHQDECTLVALFSCDINQSAFGGNFIY